MSFFKKLFGAQENTHSVVFECPFCQTQVSVGQHLAGSNVSCLNSDCRREFSVPAHYFQSGNYCEKDNRGTAHDCLDAASSYWFARLSAIKKDPFVIHTFDTEKNAREALLELPCIRVAQDTKRLICTEVLIFGCYRMQDGKYEAVICGDDLTFELWEQARASFARHGGRLKNEKAPERRVLASSTPLKSKPTSSRQVTFLNEYQARHQMGEVCTYTMYRGPSAAAAREFLAQKPVTRNYHYVVVETPEGNYARDISGIYKE